MLKQFEKPTTTEKRVKVGGVPGRRVELSGKLYGVPVRAEAQIAWNAKHRMVVTVMAVSSANKLPPRARAFLDSLVLHQK